MKKIYLGLIIVGLLGFLFSAEAAFDQQHGTRSVAMGSAYTAVADDLGAINWNPAGLTNIKGLDFSYTGADLMNVGLNYSYFACGTSFGNTGAGISLSVIDDTVLPYTEKTMTFAIAHSFTSFQVGAAINIFELDSIEQGKGVGIDLGVQTNKRFGAGNIGIGLMLHNAYSKINYTTGSDEIVNRYLSFGIAYKYSPRALFAFDIHGREMSLGCEYYIVDNLAARMGINNGEITAGFSVKASQWTIDYAYLLRALGNENRISVQKNF